MAERGRKHLFNGLVRRSNTITNLGRMIVSACRHPHMNRQTPLPQTHTPLWQTEWHLPPLRRGRVCITWEGDVCPPVWLDRQKGEETVRGESKLACVSWVARPWVRWAILIEGTERYQAPLVLKPLYRFLMAPWGYGGGAIQWRGREFRRKLSFTCGYLCECNFLVNFHHSS